MRIYNPQNQFGENLSTVNALLKALGYTQTEIDSKDIKTLIGEINTLIGTKGTASETTVFGAIKSVADELTKQKNASEEGTLAQQIATNASAIQTLRDTRLQYMMGEAGKKGSDYADGDNLNKIVLIPGTTSTGDNNYTEYLIVAGPKAEDGVTQTYVAEKLGEFGVDSSAITKEIGDINAKIAGENETLGTTAKTLVGAINEVKDTADSAIQGIGTVTDDTTHGVNLTLSKTTDNKINASVSVTAATLSDDAFGASDTKFAQAKDVQTAIGTAISAEDAVVNAKSIEMASMSGAVTADAKVKVAISGTIGSHSIAVTTSDIASASDLTALEGSVGTAADAANAEGSVYARIAATKAVADTAIQGITGDTTEAVKVVFTESDAHEVTTAVTVSTAATTGTGNDLKLVVTDTAALATAANVQSAIEAAEARAKAAQTYTADDETISVDGNKFSALTAAVAENAKTLTTGGQVYTAIEAAKTEVKGTGFNATNVDIASATDKVKVTLGGTVAEPTIAVATADIASATDLTTEVTARKTADAALVASVTGDLTTGNASDVVKVIASTAEGNATDGTGKAVTLGVQVTTATVEASTKALSGTGLATGTQVQGAIDEAVKSITTGSKVAVGQVLTAAGTEKLSLAGGKLTVTPATGVASFKILEVRYDGEEWAGKLDGTNAIVLWDGDAPAGSVPTSTEKFAVDYFVKSITA